MAAVKYEAIAKNYARLVREGKLTLEKIPNVIVRERVRELLAEEKQSSN